MTPPTIEGWANPDGSGRGNWSRKGCISPATRPAAFFIFSRAPTQCISWAAWAHFFTFPSANPIKKEFRSALPRKLLPTTGISWMDFGFFFWRFFTWENNSNQIKINTSKIRRWPRRRAQFAPCAIPDTSGATALLARRAQNAGSHPACDRATRRAVADAKIGRASCRERV